MSKAEGPPLQNCYRRDRQIMKIVTIECGHCSEEKGGEHGGLG